MAKKKFTDDFDSLFSGMGEDSMPAEALKAADKQPEHSDDDTRNEGKNFADDLQSFLEDAFEETLTEQLSETSNRKKSKTKKRSRGSLGGLDMLIRSTVSMDEVEVRSGKHTRRVTVLIEQEKLEKLRTIAKTEKTIVKDVIASIVEEYLDQYETRQ